MERAATELPWIRTVAGRLLLVALSVLVLGGVLVGTSLSTFGVLREQLDWINDAGRLRRGAFELMYLAGALDRADAAARPALRSQLADSVRDYDQQLREVTGRSDLSGAAELRARWRDEIQPALASMTAPGAPAPAPGLAPLLRRQAADANALVDAAVQRDQRRTVDAMRYQYASIALVLVAFLVAWWVGRHVGRRTRALSGCADRIAAGEHGLVAPEDDRDELGLLGGTVNRMKRSLMDRIDTEARARARSDELLAAVRGAVASLSRSLPDVASAAEQLATGARGTESRVAAMSTAVDEATQATRHAAAQARDVVEGVERSEQTARGGRDAVGEVVDGMSRARRTAEQVISELDSLERSIGAIEEIIRAVDDLARRTQMVAINSRVLAARLGEEGRGFTVLADEIGTLSKQSREATVRAREILTEIEQARLRGVDRSLASREAVLAVMEKVSAADATIEELSRLVGGSALLAHGIQAAASQHADGMEHLREEVKAIEAAARESFTAASATDAAARELDALADELKTLIAAPTTAPD